jgi:chromosome segregation ATPase
MFLCHNQEHSAAMPRNKGRRRETNQDWEASGTEECFVNSSGGNSSSNRVGAGGVSERVDDNENDHTSNNASGGRSRQSRGGSSSQREHQPDLGQWTQAVSETVQSMGAAHRTIKELQDKFISHMDDLKMMEETRNRLNQLEEKCREKDKEIMRQESTITTLTNIGQKTKAKIERKEADLEKERREIDLEKAKQEKRVTVATAEERLKLENEFKKLLTEHGQSYDKRKEELEDEFMKQKDDNNRRVTALEAKKKQLWTTVEEQKRTIEVQVEKLEKTTEQCDVLERAKDSVKRDKQAREMELQMIKKEFALNPKSKDYLYVF